MLTVQQTQTPDGYTVCEPRGELDAFTVAGFRRALSDTASHGRVIIDLSGVAFLDSTGLGALIGGIRRTRERGGQVAIACKRPTLARLLRSTGIDRIVTVADSVAEAAAGLQTTEPTYHAPAIGVECDSRDCPLPRTLLLT